MKPCTFRPEPSKFFLKKFLLFFSKKCPTLKKFLIFSQKKAFLIFSQIKSFTPSLKNKRNPLGRISYTLGNRNPPKMPYT